MCILEKNPEAVAAQRFARIHSWKQSNGEKKTVQGGVSHES